MKFHRPLPLVLRVFASGLFVLMAGQINVRAADTGTAISILYDTSGSMGDKIPDAEGKKEAKYIIANTALQAIVEKIDAYAKNHDVEVELITFRKTEIPLAKWNKAAFTNFLQQFRDPGGNTPLGETIFTAANDVKRSKLAHKHVVVITDGESNGALDPAKALEQITKQGGPVAQVHIIAFDVSAKVFDQVKKAGASVLPASGKSLQVGLQALFGEKILLEDE